ncbi:MAG: 6-phosphofructokinase, partial [Pseudomonadota bacterium]
MAKANAFYAQSGGVTAVINSSACGVIETARKHKDVIGKVYAGRNGILGALNEELIDTSKESARAIAGLRSTPSGAFGSCRYKLKSLDENAREYQRLIDVFRAHNIRYFFYNGGGDSQDTANKVSQLGKRLGYDLTCIGVPKTVDNDLPGDIGHPCLIPLFIQKSVEMCPPFLTHAILLLSSIIIHFLKLSPNPKHLTQFPGIFFVKFSNTL